MDHLMPVRDRHICVDYCQAGLLAFGVSCVEKKVSPHDILPVGIFSNRWDLVLEKSCHHEDDGV